MRGVEIDMPHPMILHPNQIDFLRRLNEVNRCRRQNVEGRSITKVMIEEDDVEALGGPGGQC